MQIQTVNGRNNFLNRIHTCYYRLEKLNWQFEQIIWMYKPTVYIICNLLVFVQLKLNQMSLWTFLPVKTSFLGGITAAKLLHTGTFDQNYFHSSQSVLLFNQIWTNLKKLWKLACVFADFYSFSKLCLNLVKYQHINQTQRSQ